MNKQELKKIEKQIEDALNLLREIEIRPCKGDADIKQKEIEIEELENHIRALEKDHDQQLYHYLDKPKS